MINILLIIIKFIFKKQYINKKYIILEDVKKNGLNLNNYNYIFKNDKEVVLAAIKENPKSLIYASKKMKNNGIIILEAVRKNPYLLKHASINVKNNKFIVLEAVRINGCAIEFASKKLKNDEDIAFTAINSIDYSFNYISDELKNNKNFLKKILKTNPYVINLLNIDLKNDKDLIIEALNIEPYLITHTKFPLDKEMIIAAISKEPYLLSRIFDKIKNNENLLLNILSEDYRLFNFFPNYMKLNKIFILKAIKINEKIFEIYKKNLLNFSGELGGFQKIEYEVFLFTCLKENNLIINYFPKEWFNDFTIMTNSFIANPNIQLPENIYDNDMFWINLINRDNKYIQYLPDFLKNDENFLSLFD